MVVSVASSQALLPEWSAQLTTKAGMKLNVRPASGDDEQRLLDFFEDVTADDLRFRFLSGLRHVGQPLVHQLTELDHDRTEHLLAFDARDGALVASVMIAADERMEKAEVAVVVRSDLKGRGIGWAMLEHACDYAAARGIRRVECIEAADNRTAISLEQEMGFETREFPGDSTLRLVIRDLEAA